MLPFERTQGATLDRVGVNTGRFEMSEHQGAHIDAPIHFVAEGIAMEAVPADDLIAEAVVVDASEAAARDQAHRVSASDVDAWEATHGTIPDRSWVLIHTGWAERWSDPARYLNADEGGRLLHPALEPEAARLLVDRGVAGVGIDTLSVDNALVGDDKGASHKVLHGAGRYVMENLARLDELTARGTTIFIGALPIVGGTGGPARVLAFVPDPGAGDRD